MKLIIAGSREIEVDAASLNRYICWFKIESEIEEVISGNSGNADLAGEVWSVECLGKDATKFPAEWDKYQYLAGSLRNGQMADVGDALLLIWDGRSSGSRDMKIQMLTRRKRIYEVVINETETYTEYNTK